MEDGQREAFLASRGMGAKRAQGKKAIRPLRMPIEQSTARRSLVRRAPSRPQWTCQLGGSRDTTMASSARSQSIAYLSRRPTRLESERRKTRRGDKNLHRGLKPILAEGSKRSLNEGRDGGMISVLQDIGALPTDAADCIERQYLAPGLSSLGRLQPYRSGLAATDASR